MFSRAFSFPPARLWGGRGKRGRGMSSTAAEIQRRDMQRQLLTLIREFAAEQSQGGGIRPPVWFCRLCWESLAHRSCYCFALVRVLLLCFLVPRQRGGSPIWRIGSSASRGSWRRRTPASRRPSSPGRPQNTVSGVLRSSFLWLMRQYMLWRFLTHSLTASVNLCAALFTSSFSFRCTISVPLCSANDRRILQVRTRLLQDEVSRITSDFSYLKVHLFPSPHVLFCRHLILINFIQSVLMLITLTLAPVKERGGKFPVSFYECANSFSDLFCIWINWGKKSSTDTGINFSMKCMSSTRP